VETKQPVVTGLRVIGSLELSTFTPQPSTMEA